MLTKKFWVEATDRAVKTAAQTLVTLWGGAAAFNLFDIDPGQAAGLAGGALVLSYLTSLVSAPFGEQDSASLLPTGR